MTFAEVFAACEEASRKQSLQTDQPWNISRETFMFWKSNSGNAKARRRWRRRDVPNTQRLAKKK